MGKFNVISSDSHVVEPVDLWTSRLDPKYQDRGPYVKSQKGEDRWFIDGDYDMGSIGFHVQAGQRYEDPSKLTSIGSRDEMPGGYDADQRLRDMQMDGVDGDILYPSIALRMFRYPDTGMLSDIFRCYNDWLSEFCSSYPHILKGIAMINVDDVPEGVEELKRAKGMGLAGGMISVEPQEDHRYDHPDYEPLWASAEELGMPLSLHVGSNRTSGGSVRITLQGAASSKPEERTNIDSPVRLSLAAMVLSGVFERYPGLKVVSVEHGLGWIPYFKRQLDFVYRERTEQAQYRFKSDVLPSELVRRNVLFSFQDDDLGIRLRDEIGVETLMWGSDYPHSESTFPKSQEVLDMILEGVSQDERDKIVGGNAASLYHFG